MVTQRPPSEEEIRALLFALKIVKHVKSNAIVFAREGQLVGVGAGQMSRVDSVKLGAGKAVLPLAGTVMASDAFFPFPDGVEEGAKVGITAVVQPGGSIRDREVIASADRLGLAMVFTGVRHFRTSGGRRRLERAPGSMIYTGDLIGSVFGLSGHAIVNRSRQDAF